VSFWSGEKLAEQLGGLITPFDPRQIDCAAYRLRVGPEVYISPSDDADDAKTRTKVQLAAGQSFPIPPGQFAFLLTEERVAVPKDALAFISVRATVKFGGLVNVSGFHVDPGYRGRLVFSVFNAGPAPVHLARGDDCFLIWYADLDRETALAKSGDGFDNIPTKLINPISGEIQSFEGLLAKIRANEKRMDGIDREQSIIKAIGLLIAAAILAWIFRELAPTQPAQPAALTVAPAAQPLPPPTILTVPGQITPTQPLTASPGSSTMGEPPKLQPTPPDQR
jgi:dCTP deaminase